MALTPAQRACAWFFFVMAALFLIQTTVGAASQHYRAELDGFFGFDLAQYLPYNLMRTWHVQLAIFWVSTSFVAAGIFLAPMISRREPKGQGKLAFALLGAVAVVVFGMLIGSYLGIHGHLQDAASNWFGLQGFEYLDLARFWQILLSAGLFIWVFMLWRVLRTRLRREHPGNMPWLFFMAALAIPAFYAVGLLARTGDHFTVTEFWRFWVVHLWVEDFLELFTTVMVAYMFVLLGVVRERVALVVIFLDIILYSAGGVIGTMHHLYFSGEPAEHMAMGAFFSAPEVIPLTFLTVEAWSFLQLGAAQESRVADPVPAPLGRHVPGGCRLLELPRRRHLRLPDQPADRLLLRDRHGADGQPRPRGDDGRLRDARDRAGAVLPALPDSRRQVAGEMGEDRLLVHQHRPRLDVLRHTPPARHRRSSTSRSNEGYWEARDLKFLTEDTNTLIEWLRLPGDIIFIAGGAIPVLYITWIGIRHTVKRVTLDEPEDILFTEIHRARRRGQGGRRRGRRGEGHVTPEVLLAVGYAAALLRLRRSARMAVRPHAPALAALPHRRLRVRPRSTIPGSCPEGQHLWPHEFDHDRRLVRYRAKAHICNGCPRKDGLHGLRPRAVRSCARWTPGRTPRPGASTAASR